jgi:hypothetical protein
VKLIVAAALAACAVVPAAQPSTGAAPPPATVLISPSVVRAGDAMRVTGTGWRRGARCATTVTVRFVREARTAAARRAVDLGAVRPDAAGRFTVVWRTSARSSGRWTLRVTLPCTRGPLRAVRTGLRVLPPA